MLKARFDKPFVEYSLNLNFKSFIALCSSFFHVLIFDQRRIIFVKMGMIIYRLFWVISFAVLLKVNGDSCGEFDDVKFKILFCEEINDIRFCSAECNDNYYPSGFLIN